MIRKQNSSRYGLLAAGCRLQTASYEAQIPSANSIVFFRRK
jgi:hypothetical protein